MRRIALLALCGMVIMLAAAGCKSQPLMSEEPLTGTMEEPQWVTKGVSAFPEDIGKAFYGVGIAEAKRVPDLSLRQNAAVERAHRDIGRQLKNFVEAVYKDYSEAAFTPSSDVAESRSLVESVQKSVVDETLMGAQPVDLWKNSRTGDYYQLVRLSMDSVAQQLRQKIIAVEKERLRIDAAKAHEELDEIIEKARKQRKW